MQVILVHMSVAAGRPGASVKIGQVSQVSEWKVEMIVPENKLYEVVEAYKHAHPYEVPAYEVYQTVDVDSD